MDKSGIDVAQSPGQEADGRSRTEVVRSVRRALNTDELNRTSGVRSLARGAGLVLAATPTTVLALAIGSWWTWLLHLIIATLVFCTLPSVFHEGAHRNLARRRVINDTVGTLAATLHLVPFETWRYFHLAHHAHTGTDQDSEVYPPRWSRWTLLTFPLTQWLFLYLLWKWTASTAAGHGPRWVRNERQIRAVRVNAAFTLIGIAILLAAAIVDIRIVVLLFVPLCISLMISSFTIVPEHFPAHNIGPGEPDQLDRTNSFQSNRAVRLIMWNSNYHAAHHFAPKVPAHYLPRVDGMISEIQDSNWRWKGYWSWYSTKVPQLPWRLTGTGD